MSRHLQRQIEILKKKVLHVSSLVEEAIEKSITALLTRNVTLADQVLKADDEIDRIEVDVEEEVLKTLALHQPVAGDLRFCIAVLKINTELERLGDTAESIAKRARFLGKNPEFAMLINYREMAEKAQAMVKQSIDALVNRDIALARAVREADDEVDAMRQQVQERVEREIVAHPEKTEGLVKVLSVSRNLERLADMATHIAEDVIYMIDGEIVRHHH